VQGDSKILTDAEIDQISQGMAGRSFLSSPSFLTIPPPEVLPTLLQMFKKHNIKKSEGR
jgi:hypothetical protein